MTETDNKSKVGTDKNKSADEKMGADEDDEAWAPPPPDHPPPGASLRNQLQVNASSFYEKLHVTKEGDGAASGAASGAAGGQQELPAGFIGCGSRFSGSQVLEIFRLTSSEREELVRGLRLKLSISENEAAALLREHQVESLIVSLAADIKVADSPQRHESVISFIQTHPLCIALIRGPALILKSQLYRGFL